MSEHALVIGGTRFIGRHTVREFLEAGYAVTVFNRGDHENPFADEDRVDHVEGDRETEADLRRAGLDLSPDVVVDCIAYRPRDVHAATDIFADADAYVYISSGDAYGAERVPKREGETSLKDCPVEAATDDSPETYGQRKAEGDRAVFAAADRGVNAMSIRPPVVYGPHDYTGRFDYWIDRIETHDRIVVPGDGTNLRHLVYVADVASAIRTVAEEGAAGEAYNVGDGHVPVLGEWVELIADACGVDVEPTFASERELGTVGRSLDDFPLYRDYPHLLETSRLRSLGWEPTSHEEALAATVEEHRESERTGRDGPDRETEERLLDVLGTVE
ncbi:NAD-dependent epimerase/dehydratase family protein [Natronomonas sp. F2-12]|jgi:nucleoside-diphosphate-sugar epimerase|uniref:NAD-dependent epimerase/dehydratase family protein n=1 Tax=Natronomonas aquatica TaxID=2841590 RepID=A0A9R1D5R3_9EURY|nr:NAD-dependent epimerase/dehydratase family protein [Natronomonas aquatica]MCQ4333386.1 NAD-dependent epimerase/dehydratase family protein [Natronomonas aquatica]